MCGRYTARALTRMLERHSGWEWEAQRVFAIDQSMAGVGQLADYVMERIQESSGPYQMCAPPCTGEGAQ